jgi:hypothetical protein
MLPEAFLERLEFIHPRDIVELLKREDRPKAGVRWVLKNEVRPVDLYCYLGARFGRPNGIQNFLRKDDSDNLVHWEWFLKVGTGFIMIQGMNFRTDVWISGVDGVREGDKEEFVGQIKQDFSRHGKAMGDVRKALEHWVEFVNPYQRLRRAVTGLMEELSALDLDAERDRVPDLADELARDNEAAQESWNAKGRLYSRAFGLAFGLRSMLPVMGEAFVNLMLYILMKPELRGDERLRENVVRQQIDIRIRSLSHNCVGFERHVDYASEPCRRFHTLMNERNDLLHGNLVVDKLRFNELYFLGKVPVFIQYSSMWDRSMGVAHRAVGVESIKDELNVVDGLIEYLLSCLRDDTREVVRGIANKFDLGFCLDDGRLGILFANWLVDFVPVFDSTDEVEPSSGEPTDSAPSELDKGGSADGNPE